MKFDQHIKEVALLGTNKRKIDSEKLPGTIANVIAEDGHESKLLAAIAIDLYYKKAGTLPQLYQGEIQGTPIKEDNAIAPAALADLLNAITLVEGPVSTQLLTEWCEALIQNNWLVPVQQVIPLMNAGKRLVKANKNKVVQVIGKKGTWVIQQTEEYQKEYLVKAAIVENVWEEGTTNDRFDFFLEQRKENPKFALELLQNTWDTESIQVKGKFLRGIQTTATKTDISFLEALYRKEFKYSAKEKVKQVACRRIIAETLLALPDSDLHKHTTNQLQQYLQLPEGKNLFKKLLSANTPKLVLPEKADDFWNPLLMKGVFGFEEKNIDIGLFKTDALYWFSCFVQVIPIDAWSQLMGLSDQECLKYFIGNETFLYNVKGEQFSCLVPGLRRLAIDNKDIRIANALLNLKHLEKDPKLLAILTPEQWETHVIYNELFYDGTVLRSCALPYGQEWSQNFSKKLVMAILKKLRTQSSIYDYQIGQYAAMRFNEDSIQMLEKMNETETSSLKSSNWWERHFYSPIIEATKIKSTLKNYR